MLHFVLWKEKHKYATAAKARSPTKSSNKSPRPSSVSDSPLCRLSFLNPVYPSVENLSQIQSSVVCGKAVLSEL